MRVHKRIEPIKIAIGLINKIGIFEYKEEWLFESDLHLIVNLLDKCIIRIEYDAVIPIVEIIIKVKIHSIFEEIIFSIIMSLEKNPEVKGNPIKAALVNPRIVVVIGILIVFILIIRMSW